MTANATPVSADMMLDAYMGAAQSGLNDIVRDFVERFPDAIDKRDRDGMTAISWAAFNGWSSTTMLLLELGADVSGALLRATHEGRCSVMCLLLENNADVNEQDRFGFTPLMFAAGRSKSLEAIEILLEHGADIYLKDSAGMTAADHAREEGQPTLAQFIEEWPERQQKLKQAVHAAFIRSTDFSRGLSKPMALPKSPFVRKFGI